MSKLKKTGSTKAVSCKCLLSDLLLNVKGSVKFFKFISRVSYSFSGSCLFYLFYFFCPFKPPFVHQLTVLQINLINHKNNREVIEK
ncbi:hypothetical protein BEH94_01450 [Candidatus Altiarchaeales archaeon WOR_SM1_SCG]|nr:hypothetical protein BEH94_01450 [Candidatus Altiarchaeales archaeon WOR_SM1_SCG]